MENVLLILAYMLIGLVLKRTGQMPEQTGPVLNQYVINVAVPAMILLHLPQLEVSTAVLTPALMPWFMFALAVSLVLLSSRLLGWSRELTAALLIIVPLGNTSFVGFPMVEAMYGSDGLPYAVIYDQLGSFITLAVFATTIAAIYGRNGEARPSGLSLIKKLLFFPPVLGLLAAIFFGQTDYPGLLQPLIENLASTLVPVVMVSVGFQLHFKIPRHDIQPFAIGLSIKLLVLPAVALMTLASLGITDLAAKVSVLEAAMPPMITAGALAMSAGLRPALVASMVGYGIILGMLTLPAWAWFTQVILA